MSQTNKPSSTPKPDKLPKGMTAEQYARLKQEASAPYRGLRKFIYAGFGASGLIGAMIFLAQLAGGGDVSSLLPNLGVQIGVVALMIWLFRLENKAEAKDLQRSLRK
jgi:hypothetical protein